MPARNPRVGLRAGMQPHSGVTGSVPLGRGRPGPAGRRAAARPEPAPAPTPAETQGSHARVGLHAGTQPHSGVANTSRETPGVGLPGVGVDRAE